MRKSDLLYRLGIVALLALAFQSCKKENGIDNDSVIKKPYGLYIGTENGALLNTTNGTDYKTIFNPDGFASRALVTSGMNIIWVKDNVHLSEDNGRNFNPTYFYPNKFYLSVRPYFPWQSIILDAPDQNRVYLGSISIPFGSRTGIVYSDDHGKTWIVDTAYDNGIANSVFTSFIQLDNGTIFAHNITNDSLYKKDNKNDRWSYVEQIGLPAASHAFYLSHNGNTLLYTDAAGTEGVYYSNDEGKNWSPYTGLPDRNLYVTAAPFGQNLLVGTDSLGVYRLENNTFVPSNSGLDDYTTVYAIVGKEDVYKNDVRKRYVYIATSKGLYRSENYGRSWSLVQQGSFVAVY